MNTCKKWENWSRYLPQTDTLADTSVTPALSQLQFETPENPSQTNLETPNVTHIPQSYAERNVTDVTDKQEEMEEQGKRLIGWELDIK